MSKVFQYIVVGSGPTGAMAAQTLVEAGKEVVMLDVGKTDTTTPDIPDKDYVTIRRTEPDQYDYLIGKNLEGVVWGKVGKGEQVTPGRKHMMDAVDTLTPVHSRGFTAFESLGYGGLGIGWGIGCWEWSNLELKEAGLSASAMDTAYSEVCERIGISATKDSASDYTIRDLRHYQPSADMDRNSSRLYANYLKREKQLRKQGFVMGRAPLALLTEDKDGRKKYSYKDMDFYSDKDRSAYRPWITIDLLRKQPNFTYLNDMLVVSYNETDEGQVIVHCRNSNTGVEIMYRCQQLVLAAGIFGTARIVLRSSHSPETKLPILCNSYSYIPCIQVSSLGKEVERHKLGFAQLSFFLDEEGKNFGASMASLYTYQSLMLFRMIRQVPLNFKDAHLLLRYMMSGIIIMGIHQPDSPSTGKYLMLENDDESPTHDALYITYTPAPAETTQRTRREKKYMQAIRKLGIFPLKRIDPGIGSSIHYAGTLPFSDSDTPFTLAENGRLHGARNVYVADGSGFRYLPAKGLTFTLMANAHRIAKGLAKL